MDAIEFARQEAARMHAAAIARGGDPAAPLGLVLAEAGRLGLDVESARPGARVLTGARAKYVAADAMIYYEDAGTLFDRAFLIAHELGHAVLGDGGGGCEIDPSRPAEAAPVGIERVIDHGPKQRREVQMDLFAREFLLPRSLVRDLHLDHGMTAAEIIAYLGAPAPVVAQQLLDALLLPAVEAGGDGSRRPKPLNDRQRDAARHRGSAFLLGAGPGTGKTQTLTARVADLLADAVDPRRILVLTYSNKAASEMSDRISGGHAEAFAAMWIGTFHAFGLDLLRACGDQIGLKSRNPRMLDRADAVAMLEDELPRLGLDYYQDMYDPTGVITDILDAISRAKDEVCDENDYERLALEMERLAADDVARERAKRALEVAKVYRHYEELKRARDRVDFGDLVMLAVKLLETNEEVARTYRGRYLHVLVDEYQDVNRASVRLLKALKPDGQGLWAVGDARQSIYRFRGASSHSMALFGRDFPGAAGDSLTINYRSTKEIVDLFSHFATRMSVAASGSGELIAHHGPSGSSPELRIVRDKGLRSAGIAEAIEEHRAAGWRHRDQCVLCSGNDTLADIGRELEALGVPILYLGSLFERSEVKDLLSILSLLVDPRAMGLVRVACMPEFAMDLADTAGALESLRSELRGRPGWLDDAAALASQLSPSGARALAAIARALEGYDANSHPWEVLSIVLLDRTRIAARLGASESIPDRSAAMAVWQFMNFIRVQGAEDGARVPALLSRVRRLLRLADDRELRQLPAAAKGIDAVRLMTIHGAKGLEFGVVHLPGLNGGTMPKTLKPQKCPAPDGMIEGARGTAEEEHAAGHEEEQDCLLYVAASRAEDRLLMYACSHQQGRNTVRPLSKFVERLGSGLVQRTETPSLVLPPAPDAVRVPISFEGPLRFSASRLDTYLGCARRFLYAHVLRTGGKRETTPYLQMHDAVRGLCERIVASGRTPDEAEIEPLAAEALEAEGLGESGYYGEFKGFATAMVRYFALIRRDMVSEERTALLLTVGEDQLQVTPEDVLSGPGGRVIRRIRTGQYRKKEEDNLAATALLMTAERTFPGARVELVHLSSGLITPLALKKGKAEKTNEKVAEQMALIRSGAYPTKRSSFTCPNCPALFICDALPLGALTKRC
jgi:superfamily I DNA/RNA helicase